MFKNLMASSLHGKHAHRQPSASPREVVNGRWLIKALGLTLLVAVVCAYITLCLLFYWGQWQFVLHPGRDLAVPAAIAGTPYETVHFAPDESAVPQLTGWWLPAAQGGRYAHITILYLRGGDGSLADSVSQIAELHTLGLNLFAFDYRGYGQSPSAHPTERRMSEDAAAAWQYLVTSRKISPGRIVLFGTGVGASLATGLATQHPDAPALLLQAPQGDLLSVIRKDPRLSLLPAAWLFNQTFPLADPLRSLKTPKLLITTHDAKAPAAFLSAAEPKTTVEFSTVSRELYTQSLNRFLDQYLPPTSPPVLTPERKPLS